MSTHLRTLLVLLGCLLVCLGPAPAQDARRGDLTPARVRTAIKNGIEYLKGEQRDGHWETTGLGLGGYRGGVTSLVMLALLESGVDPDDQVITDGLRWLRKLPPEDTYVVALQTMVFAHAKPKDDQLLIKRNVDWLRDTVKRDAGNKIIGWGYPRRIPGADNSNSQYAVLALREAGVAGVPIDDQLWKEIQDFYVRTQNREGGWPYRTDGRADNDRITMTAAGVSGLLITGMQLYKKNERIEKDGTILNCGKFEENDPLSRGLKRMGETFTVDFRPFRYYNLYGIERVGRISGQRFFSGRGGETHDWYRAGAELLITTQTHNGSWLGDNIDGAPAIATSFALLFLAKGKTPVLIHKMMHGARPRGLVGDWNNDRNDARNLTEYCSQQIFRKDGRAVPLTWQAFDASKLRPADPQSVAELLQAPILYITGHKAPDFTDGEVSLLRKYIEEGGFILAEACCGRNGRGKEFDAGFRELVKRIWQDEPDRKLEPLPPGHAIWTAAFPVTPGSFNLEGIDFGCKTCLVYAPEDLSCHWESNRFDGPDGRTILAFRTGANIVAYATGLEPPQDKLTHILIATNQQDKIIRGALHVAQLNYGGRDWQPAPRAMQNLMHYLHQTWDVAVVPETRPLAISDVNLPNYKFLYMHGRREFTMPPENQKLLREHLIESGGLLLADACCGSEKFDASFRKLMEETFPDRPLEEIKLSDPLYSDKIGKPIKSVMCRTQRGAAYTSIAPQLEGIRLDPKNPSSPWIVIYSKYDLGCALDKHSSPDCLGHNHESALDLAAQVVLYALKE